MSIFGNLFKSQEEIDAIELKKAMVRQKELDEFIDSLTTDQFEKVTDFFDTMPKVQHSVEVTNPKTKKKSKVIIEGIQSFFD